MNTYGRNTKVAAIVLGVVAIAGCSSSSKPAATTTTSTMPRATTTTTTRRRTETSTTTVTPTTRATTQSSAPSAVAVSASFVSSSQGFALERSGTVAATTDGGRSWHRVGNLPTHDEEIIRYIDAADGFAFARRSGPLMITHDGGATWTATPTPFTDVFDLAIARGTVYVVALKTGPTVDFQIWSTPVAHLVWKRDPLTLPVGAGPVASVQIVLTGGKGWILGVNRTVIAGARLMRSGTWSTWNPPCLHEFGPAYLSASTATDLVASCDEGVWGGPFKGITHTVWFSHNGGTTFVRKTAPGFGPVLSPSPQTAIVAGGGGLQRTIDGGSSWHDVLPFDGTGGQPDYGFTTSTQGFMLLGHEMLMTRDAGASWQSVTLP